MTKLGSLKNDLKVMGDLESLTDVLEQTAARSIVRMRTNILNSRPYFREIWRINNILKKLTPPAPEVVHKHLVVLIGLDWGMTGNLLNLVCNEASRLQKAHGTDLLVAGKMAYSYFRDYDGHTVHFFSVPRNASLVDIQPIYKVVAGYAKVTMVYPVFESLSKQSVATASFSIGDRKITDKDAGSNESSIQDEIESGRFIVDPSPQEIVNYLNEAVVGLTVHHYFAESMLAYSAAQMIAMRNGHDNAKKERKKIQMRYHRADRELVDIKLRELYNSRSAHRKKGT